MKEIFLAWWDAHLFEFILSGYFVTILLVVVLAIYIIDIFRTK